MKITQIYILFEEAYRSGMTALNNVMKLATRAFMLWAELYSSEKKKFLIFFSLNKKVNLNY